MALTTGSYSQEPGGKVQILNQDIRRQFVPMSAVMTGDGILTVGADPKLETNMLYSLLDDIVAKELGVGDKAISVAGELALRFQQERRTGLQSVREGKLKRIELDGIIATQRVRAGEVLDELLTPEQRKRLSQILYRLEIMHIGLGNAIAGGRTSVAIEVYENQKSTIRAPLQSIDRHRRNSHPRFPHLN